MFDTVIAGHNTKVYVRFEASPQAPTVVRMDKVIELSAGDKTVADLATELQTKLQAAKPTTAAFSAAFSGTTVTVVPVDNCRLKFGV